MDKFQKMVTRLERRVQPTDDFYKFEMIELEDELRDAFACIGIDVELDEITPQQELVAMYKARSECYYFLAGKHAENIRVKIENDEYHGNQPYHSYMNLGRKYEALFNENSAIQVNTVTRRQTGTGLKAPYYPGDTP